MSAGSATCSARQALASPLQLHNRLELPIGATEASHSQLLLAWGPNHAPVTSHGITPEMGRERNPHTTGDKTFFFQKCTCKSDAHTLDLGKAEFGKSYNQRELHLDLLSWKGSRTPSQGYKTPPQCTANRHGFSNSSRCFRWLLVHSTW